MTAKDANPIDRSSSIRPRPHLIDNFDKTSRNLLSKCDAAEMTGSFLHLHVALDANGLNLDKLEAHYTGESAAIAANLGHIFSLGINFTKMLFATLEKSWTGDSKEMLPQLMAFWMGHAEK